MTKESFVNPLNSPKISKKVVFRKKNTVLNNFHKCFYFSPLQQQKLHVSPALQAARFASKSPKAFKPPAPPFGI